jgi:hypothetical protein
MYLAAYGRPPAAKEENAALEFLKTQSAAIGSPAGGKSNDERVWADLAHVLLNVSEFNYIE